MRLVCNCLRWGIGRVQMCYLLGYECCVCGVYVGLHRVFVWVDVGRLLFVKWWFEF